jgi:hypothetical protein
LLFDVKEQTAQAREAKDPFKELARKGTEFLNAKGSSENEKWEPVKLEPAALRVLVALSQLKTVEELHADMGEDEEGEAPIQDAIADVAGYKVAWTSENLLELHLRLKGGREPLRLVDIVPSPKPPNVPKFLRRKDLYFVTDAGNELLDHLFS